MCTCVFGLRVTTLIESGRYMWVCCREVDKVDFEELVNNKVEPETFVECIECGRKWHQICALTSESIWPTSVPFSNILSWPSPVQNYQIHMRFGAAVTSP